MPIIDDTVKWVAFESTMTPLACPSLDIILAEDPVDVVIVTVGVPT